MSTKVLVLGLDAAEATLIEKWSGEGHLPTFSHLTQKSKVYKLNNCMHTLPGAIWPEIVSGRSSGKLGIFYHPSQLHSGEATTRPVAVSELNAEEYFWTVASRAGKRVAVIDTPQTALAQDFNGIQLMEWGLHDRPFKARSDPASLIDHINDKYGHHLPHHAGNRCDYHGQTVEGYRTLLNQLLDGVERKSRLLKDLLQLEEWDLFIAGYGESHCVGHQFWNSEARESTEEFHDAILRVYCRIDQGIGQLLDIVGEEIPCIIFASHGMGPYVAGYQLLKEFLVRLGLGSAHTDNPVGRRIRLIQDRVNRFAPRGLYPTLSKIAKSPAAKSVQSKAGSLANPLESNLTKASTVRNNRCGAIRLNLVGREPNGCVRPGTEAEQLIAFIKTELMLLRDPESGEKIVKHAVSAVELFGPDHHPDVPDIMVDFRTDLGVLEACLSERVGLIKTPYFHTLLPRTGDHTPVSRLWLSGPAIAASKKQRTASVLDIAPTALSFLGIEPPGFIDGKSLI